MTKSTLITLQMFFHTTTQNSEVSTQRSRPPASFPALLTQLLIAVECLQSCLILLLMNDEVGAPSFYSLDQTSCLIPNIIVCPEGEFAGLAFPFH